ncbi:geranylgeranyl pyrophosphate synthase [Fimicolochytrium jonesii]|uniref:geranylgeranyl pyrophosphate synthase n=1 Tax=Fimicolochytrium jonesii TaxID=1396493 RepID=UPI0022FDDC73|nr:geranylgeranyl pyrophosphate synthase [Fimicolochytrium jonesii]KAI8819363.1 geranylgeranyl pyrophosphate synthase [Fimicolochytrium jonesii]
MSYLSSTPLSPDDKVLLEPFLYLTSNPGKEIRTKLLEAFGEWLQVPATKLQVIKETVEMLHSASLLIDDVEDDSMLRRGNPVAHKIYGVPATINCANYVYFLALQKLFQLNDPRAMMIYTEELLQLHKGQGMEIHWRDSSTCPTEEQYMDMVKNKTGGLLRLAIKLMQISTEGSRDYTDLVNILGVHYQVRDDYMNLQSNLYSQNKGFAEDLTEGKFSFPIIHCIRTDTSNNTLLSILKQKTDSPELKNFAIQLMKKTNSFEYVRQYLVRIEAEARAEIARLGGNAKLEKYLDILAINKEDCVDAKLEA